GSTSWCACCAANRAARLRRKRRRPCWRQPGGAGEPFDIGLYSLIRACYRPPVGLIFLNLPKCSIRSRRCAKVANRIRACLSQSAFHGGIAVMLNLEIWLLG